MRRWFPGIVVSLLAFGLSPLRVSGAPTGASAAAKKQKRPPAFDKSAYEQGQGGILYGKGWAFLISAPKGWVMEEQGSGLGGSQVNVAFHHRGQSFAQADAVMYGNVIPKIRGEDDTFDKVIRGDIETTKEHDPKMKAEVGKPLETGDGSKTAVYTFSGPGTGRAQEQVVYVDTPRFVIMLVLTSRSETAYKMALPDFASLVHSFIFMNKTEEVQRAKPHPAKGSKKGL